MQNLTGLEKPLAKLVETVSEGIGVVGNHLFEFDVAKIKRTEKTKIEADKAKIIATAEAQAQAIVILGRAGKRFALEQYAKQINLENILVKTKDDLKGKNVSEEPVEKDWITRFLDLAQNVSREELQDLLAKILSGEIQNPGSFSYQTLEVVKYLSQKDLQKLLRFIAVSTEMGILKLKEGGKESLIKYNLSFNDYLDLSSIGLFNQSSMISYDISLPASTPLSLVIGKDSYLIVHDDKQTPKKFDFGLYIFSNVGKELRKLLIDKAINEKLQDYEKDFVEEVQKKGFKISNHKSEK